MSVSHDDVRRIAALARIAVPDDRLDELARELTSIVGHIDALSEVASPPGASDAASGMRLAGDAGPPVQLERTRDVIAPSFREGLFLVPRLSTHESTGDS